MVETTEPGPAAVRAFHVFIDEYEHIAAGHGDNIAQRTIQRMVTALPIHAAALADALRSTSRDSEVREAPKETTMSDPNLPPIFADDREAADLLLQAVNLHATVHNMLIAASGVMTSGGERFWRQMHEVREVLNRPENERLRIAYVRALGHANPGSIRPGDRSLEPNPVPHPVGRDFHHEHNHPEGTDCSGRPTK